MLSIDDGYIEKTFFILNREQRLPATSVYYFDESITRFSEEPECAALVSERASVCVYVLRRAVAHGMKTEELSRGAGKKNKNSGRDIEIAPS